MSNSPKFDRLLQRLHKLQPAQLQLLQIDLEMERRRRAAMTKAEQSEGLLDFIPRISPKFMRPAHLARLTDVLERTEREPVRAIVNLPPRHSKTETILHFIARRLRRRPWENIGYATYVDQIANEKSVLAREYAVRAGVQMRDDANRLNRWITTQMGGAVFTSIGGSITGLGVDVLVVDDPHKDRADAESAAARDKVWNWYIGTALDRVETGGSVIICQTRWHPDDLTGRLLEQHAEDGWEVISLPALGYEHEDGTRIDDDNGEALWPERWPKEELLKKKRDDYEWRSKFQQRPVARGGAVFKDVRYYDPRTLPASLRISVGIDLAYSEKTHADYSACVVLGQDYDGRVYVLGVAREQMEVPAFSEVIKGMVARWPTTKITWHTATTEAGTAQLLKSLTGLNVKNERAAADKFVRSQPVAAAWNMGEVLVPAGYDDEYGNHVPPPTWVAEFVKEVTKFTGIGDKKDDQVDALSSAYSAWFKPASGRIDY